MRIKLTILSLLAMLLTFGVFAQTNAEPGVGTLPLPQTTSEFWTWAIAALTPLIVWAAKKAVPSIPKPLLPVATPVIGIILGIILNRLGKTDFGWMDMAKAGALAVFIRETVNQLITKRLETEKPEVA